jgi:Carboxypeptidase regulatory-like domain
MAIDELASDEPRSLPRTVRAHFSLTRVQGLCGMAAALLSIGGAFGYFAPVRHDRGEVLAIVQEARTGKPVADASVEVLTLHDVLVTTLPPAAGAGSARAPMKEGTYRLRVTHPRYATESRQIYVLNGQTAEIHVRLTARPAPPAPADRSAGGPIESLKKLFR